VIPGSFPSAIVSRLILPHAALADWFPIRHSGNLCLGEVLPPRECRFHAWVLTLVVSAVSGNARMRCPTVKFTEHSPYPFLHWPGMWRHPNCPSCSSLAPRLPHAQQSHILRGTEDAYRIISGRSVAVTIYITHRSFVPLGGLGVSPALLLKSSSAALTAEKLAVNPTDWNLPT
jgi:hypothetical protein